MRKKIVKTHPKTAAPDRIQESRAKPVPTVIPTPNKNVQNQEHQQQNGLV